MTRSNRPITRRTYSTYRGRDLVVTIHSTFLEIHLYNTRRRYLLDHVAAYQCAVKLETNRLRAEQAQARKTNKKRKRKERGK